MIKNILKKIVLVGIVSMGFAMSGCDSKPTSFNIDDDGWELWREGTLTNKKIVTKDQGTTMEKRIFELEFDLGDRVSSSRVHEFEKIVAGSTGYLYCWDGRDCDNTYVWIPVNSRVASVPVDKKEIIAIEPSLSLQKLPLKTLSAPMEDNYVSSNGWQNISNKPTAYQTVLVKFQNELTTTAYQTKTGDWKADMNRDKLSGGISLKEIVQWKTINLE